MNRRFADVVRHSSFSSSNKREILHYKVLAVCRYMKDPTFTDCTGISLTSANGHSIKISAGNSITSMHHDSDVYDLVLTDGKETLKCLLSPSCNCLIQNNELTTGCVVEINPADCVMRENELSISADAFAIIKIISVVTDDKLTTCSGSVNVSSGLLERPLVTTRGCYQYLWNCVDPFLTKEGKNTVKRIDFIPVSVSDLASTWKTLARPYPPLVLRVLHRSRIHCYGTPAKSSKWPYQVRVVYRYEIDNLTYWGKVFRGEKNCSSLKTILGLHVNCTSSQFHITAADHSGVVTVVFWNGLFQQYYNRLTAGSVCVVRNYVVKAVRFQMLPKPALRRIGIPFFDMEIDVNNKNPRGEMHIVEPSAITRFRRVPELNFSFYTRMQLCSLPNDFIIDVVGIVTHVGCCERERKSHDPSAPYEFYMYRWIELMDGTNPNPLRLELFATSQVNEAMIHLAEIETGLTRFCELIDGYLYLANQPVVHEKIQPGVVAVVTQCRVVTSFGINSVQQRPIYITTTSESQVFVRTDVAALTGPYESDPVVQQLLQWTSTSDVRKSIVKKFTVGGRYSYPPVSRDVSAYVSSFPAEKPIQLMSAEAVKQSVESLAFRERRRLHLKGVVAEVRWWSYRNKNKAAESGNDLTSSVVNKPAGSGNRLVPSVVTRHQAAASRYSLRSTSETRSTSAVPGRPVVRKSAKSGSCGKVSKSSAQTSRAKTVKEVRRKRPQAVHTTGHQTSIDDGRVIVDELWEQLKSHVTVVGCQTPHPSMFRRRFSAPRDAPVLHRHLLMPPSVFDGRKGDVRKLEDLPTVDENEDVVLLTILGVNNDVAVHTFVPRTAARHVTHDITSSSSSAALTHACRACDRLNGTMSLSSTLHCNLGKHDIHSLEGRRFLFVIDAFCPGDGVKELTLVRGYETAAFASPSSAIVNNNIEVS